MTTLGVLSAAGRAVARAGARAARSAPLASFSASLAHTRWYIIGRIAPKICACLLARGASLALGLSIFDEQLVSGFSNSAIFVLAILMAGVLEDYKESEAMPATLATSFDAITDAVAFAGLVEPAVDAKALHAETLAMLENVMAFMGGIGDDGDVLAGITHHAHFIGASLAKAGQEAGGVLDAAQEVRATLNRLYVIKRTNFLESGSALMELFVNLTMFLAVFGETGDAGTLSCYMTVGVLGLMFFYTIELLHDIDDPFEYDPDELKPVVVSAVDEASGAVTKHVGMGGHRNSAEVDLFPLMNVYARVARAAGHAIGRDDARAPLERDDEAGVRRGAAPAAVSARAAGHAAALAGFAANLRAAMRASWDEVDEVGRKAR